MRKYIHVAKALKVINESFFLLCLHVISYFVYMFPTLFTCYFLPCLHVFSYFVYMFTFSLFLHVMHVISLLWSIQN